MGVGLLFVPWLTTAHARWKKCPEIPEMFRDFSGYAQESAHHNIIRKNFTSFRKSTGNYALYYSFPIEGNLNVGAHATHMLHLDIVHNVAHIH